MTIPSYDVIIDIETNGFRRAGMQIHCIELIIPQTGDQHHGADQPGFTPLSDIRLLIENARRVIGHNIVVFDLPALERVLGIVVPTDKVIDTLIASRVLTADRRELDALDPAMPVDLIGRHQSGFVGLATEGAERQFPAQAGSAVVAGIAEALRVRYDC